MRSHLSRPNGCGDQTPTWPCNFSPVVASLLPFFGSASVSATTAPHDYALCRSLCRTLVVNPVFSSRNDSNSAAGTDFFDKIIGVTAFVRQYKARLKTFNQRLCLTILIAPTSHQGPKTGSQTTARFSCKF